MIKVMTTKNFNAKKMLMSTVAAVVFSFVFTTNANGFPQRIRKGTILKSESKGVLMRIVRISRKKILILYPLSPMSSKMFLAYEYSDLLLLIRQ